LIRKYRKGTAMAVIGTSHSAYSSYSSIKLNSEEYKKQSSSTELEKKMTQYTDTFSISKKEQENLKHLSSISSMDYVNWFENEVTEVFAKEYTTQGVKPDTFEHYVRLNCYILFCVAVIAILVGKLVHVIKKNNARSVSLGLAKCISNITDKIIVTFISSNNVGFKPTFFYEALCHKSLSKSRITV
jgi:hypothetical protein